MAFLLRIYYTSGYSHGDLQLRHLKRNVRGELRLIDFDRCKKGGAGVEALDVAGKLGIKVEYLLGGTRDDIARPAASATEQEEISTLHKD